MPNLSHKRGRMICVNKRLKDTNSEGTDGKTSRLTIKTEKATKTSPTGSLNRPTSGDTSMKSDHSFDLSFFQPFEKDAFFGLELFDSLILATVLEDAIKPFHILEECNNPLRIKRMQTDYQTLMRSKYGVGAWKKEDMLDDVNVNNLGCKEYKLNKLERDRSEIKQVLDATYIQLCSARSFRPLWEHNKENERMQEYWQFLIEDNTRNRAIAREAYKQLRLQRNQNKRVIYELDYNLDSLTRQIEDAELKFEMKGRYVEKWQTARTEQHTESIRVKEKQNIESIKHYKTSTELEARAHIEVEMLFNIIISETLASVDEWMDKYEKDIEQIDLWIQVKMGDYQNAYDRRKALEKKYADNAKAIKDWVKFKDDREAAQLYERSMHASAVVVQAWWRGLLVRKQLGPFRPKRGKRGKKK